MDIKIATGIAYENLVLANNIAEINIEAASMEIVNRSKLRYFLTLQVRPFPNADIWETLPTMDGVEETPESVGGAIIARGAFFNIEKILASYVETSAPAFKQDKITPVQNVIRPFRYIERIENNGVVIHTSTSPVYYVIAAGVNERDFFDHGKTLFSDTFGSSRRFLSFSPVCTLFPDQDAYLYFLNNLTPFAQAIKLRLYKYYDDGTSDNEPVTALTSIAEFMNLYCVPVSPAVLGVDTVLSDGKRVSSYTVWLVNENDEVITEMKTYHLNRDYYESIITLIFRNSVSGYDSLACVGRAAETLNVIREESERFREFEAPAHFSDVVINKVTGERQLTVNTGFINADYREWLEELLLSKDIFIKTDREYLPVKLSDEGYNGSDSMEYLIGRTFVFTYVNKETAYSKLEKRAEVAQRATAWRAYGNGGCQLDAYGKRTGLRHVTHLEKYYIDDESPVKPVVVKFNVVGTEGYISPQADGECSSTPFLSEAYATTGTFKKRNCGTGYYGTVAPINIAAHRWGSETDQATANAKARAEAAARDTQQYADENGSCTLLFTNGLVAKYYRWFNNPLGYPPDSVFSGVPNLQRTEMNVSASNFVFETEGFSVWWLSDPFAVSWEGYIIGPNNGPVNFRLENGGGCRLYIDEKIIIDYWQNRTSYESQISSNVVMEANVFYKIRVEYFKRTGMGNVALKWSYGSSMPMIISPSAFYLGE